jgi:hypothetical protein
VAYVGLMDLESRRQRLRFAYCGNLEASLEAIIDADPVAGAVLEMMQSRPEWTGTASDLLNALGEFAVADTWPQSPGALSWRLRRASAFLRKIGIDVRFERKNRTRAIVIAFPF